MSKELEALERIKNIPILSTPESTQKIFYDKHKKELDIIENALKALEILKIYLEPKLFQSQKPCLGITLGHFHASYEVGKLEWFILKEGLISD